jgi:hypothetical protein
MPHRDGTTSDEKRPKDAAHYARNGTCTRRAPRPWPADLERGAWALQLRRRVKAPAVVVAPPATALSGGALEAVAEDLAGGAVGAGGVPRALWPLPRVHRTPVPSRDGTARFRRIAVRAGAAAEQADATGAPQPVAVFAAALPRHGRDRAGAAVVHSSAPHPGGG